MKRLIVTLSIFALSATTIGARFEYYDGGFTATCYNYCQDYYYTSGPYSVNNNSTSDLVLEDYSIVLQASTLSRNSVAALTGTSLMHFRIFSIAAASSQDSLSWGDSSGSMETKTPSTLGVYYKIMPDVGESVGDDVLLYFTGTLSIEPTGILPGSVQGYLMGAGSMDHLAITLNQLPPVTSAPSSSKEIWTMDNLILNNSYYWGTEDFEKFRVKVGDVVGIFLKSGTSNSVTGIELGTVISNLTVTFSLNSILDGDIDEDGDVDLIDFSMFGQNWLVGT